MAFLGFGRHSGFFFCNMHCPLQLLPNPIQHNWVFMSTAFFRPTIGECRARIPRETNTGVAQWCSSSFGPAWQLIFPYIVFIHFILFFLKDVTGWSWSEYRYKLRRVGEAVIAFWRAEHGRQNFEAFILAILAYFNLFSSLGNKCMEHQWKSGVCCCLWQTTLVAPPWMWLLANKEL